jgi:HEAT repeat protein
LKAFCDAQTNDEARDSAAEALSMLGQKATGQLEALAKSAASRVRYHALKGLAQGDSTEAIPFLVEGLGDELQATRKVAWDGLKARHWTPKSGREQVLSVIAAGEAPPAVTNLDGHTVEQLVKMMGNGDAKARKAVAAALGSTRGEPATGALVKALRDGDVMVRLAAARSLESQSWKPVADGDNIRLLAAKLDFEGCSKLGPKAAPALVELLLADYGFCREWISQTLIQIGPSCIPTLTPQLGAKYDADVRMIASTLVAYGGPALEPLQKVLKEGDPRKRIWAARALRNLGNDQALPALQAALQAAPAPQTGLSRPGFQIINQSTWNQNDRTPEGAARNAIQFAITALQKKSQ